MGCCGSKVDDLHLVTLCRERKELIKAAIDHRYELAAAHALYFQSLTTVGEALCKFVEEVVSGADSDSTPSLGSPVLTLPSHHRKPQKSSDKYKGSSTSTSTSVYYTDSHRLDDKADGSHLHLSSGSDSQSDLSSDSGHIHIHESPISKAPMGSDPYPNTSPSTSLGFSYPYPNPSPQSNPHSEARAYYMKKSSVLMKSVIYEEPERYSVRENERWSAYGDGGYSGYQTGEPPGNERAQKEQPPSAPPSPPNVSSAWDYLNVFQTYDDAYPGYNLKNSYGVGSITSSPDSKEVRELEGIPDLEDETEKESVKSRYKKRGTAMGGRKNFREGRSRALPSKKNGGASAVLPSPKSEASTEMTSVDNDSMHFTTDKEINSSTSEIIMSKSSSSQGYTGTAVSFEVDEGATVDAESSNPTSLTMLPPHGTRDLQEVIREIKGEFETASGYGKEVAVLLEVGKVPYRSKDTVLKVIFSRIMYLATPSISSSEPLKGASVQVRPCTMKVGKASFAESVKDLHMKSGNISTILEKLYVWEKRLYKEIKDEEKLRIAYVKKCKKLKILGDQGAETAKMDATSATISKLHTKIDVCIKTVDAISSRIHKLRDDELQPQLTELIHGLVRAWRSIFKCHQKQFRAIMESRSHSPRSNGGIQSELSLRATVELELELLKWFRCFNQWVNAQKSYVESLNGWLLRCINKEPEETADGVAPFSPSRVGAPPIFVLCNDWFQAMERISQERVAKVISIFSLRLDQLWERQDEDQTQRPKADFISKDLEKQLRISRKEMERLENAMNLPDKTAMSKFNSDSIVSQLDDLKVDLDSIRKKLEEERAGHKETMHLVGDAASSSLQAGLISIFGTLENYASEVLKGYEQVRLDN